MKSLVLLLFVVGYATATTSTDDVLHQANDDIQKLLDLVVKTDVEASLESYYDQGSKIPGQIDIKTELGKQLMTSFENILERTVDILRSFTDQLDKITALIRKFKPTGNVYDGETKKTLKEIKEEAKQFLIKVMELNVAGEIAHEGTTHDGEEMADSVLKKPFNELLSSFLNTFKRMSVHTEKMKVLKVKLQNLRFEMSYKIKYLLMNFEKQAQTFFKKAVVLETLT